MPPVIVVESLSKKYIISHQKRERYTALRDVLANGARRFARKLCHSFVAPTNDPTHDEFWALKDVSFNIQQGDRVGIIGRNGAGKSTLLKILSRITEPTSGNVSIKGRVASLLEVGTGFHPELTGRENIFLNGAILGMRKAEIKTKFDEIVAFAEVERFLDTPVKRYSSGMYVRLAFAVAAHLEPEILIVDEVLAVGDAQFQKKCMGKMEEVGKEGRTVIFVSHNMGAVSSLCQKGILLKKGELINIGSSKEVVSHYLEGDSVRQTKYVALAALEVPYFRKIEIKPHDEDHQVFHIDQPIQIAFSIEPYEKKALVISIVIKDSSGLWVHHSTNEFGENYSENSFSEILCTIPPYGLAPGKYYVDVYLAKRAREMFQAIESSLIFEVIFSGLMANQSNGNDWKGVCGPGMLLWT